MPPQPATKNIASYFNKTPAKAVAAATLSSAKSPSASASAAGQASTKADATPSSPLTDVRSSPAPAATSSGTKRTFLSDAARQAIRDGVNAAKDAEADLPASKRAKLDPKPAPLSEFPHLPDNLWI